MVWRLQQPLCPAISSEIWHCFSMLWGIASKKSLNVRHSACCGSKRRTAWVKEFDFEIWFKRVFIICFRMSRHSSVTSLIFRSKFRNSYINLMAPRCFWSSAPFLTCFTTICDVFLQKKCRKCQKSREITANGKIHGKRQNSRFPWSPWIRDLGTTLLVTAHSACSGSCSIHALVSFRF